MLEQEQAEETAQSQETIKSTETAFVEKPTRKQVQTEENELSQENSKSEGPDSQIEPPVKEYSSKKDSLLTAEPLPAHPSALGRLSNDPRVSPSEALVEPILRPALPRAAAPFIAKQARILVADHPSKLGRLSNDPRDPGGNSNTFDNNPKEHAT